MRKANFSAILFLCVMVLDETQSNRRRHPQRCTPCPPGWGVKTACTTTTDTKCERCEHGETYSPHRSHTSPCWRCSKCGIGLYVAKECTRTGDTVCDDCTAVVDRPEVSGDRHFSGECEYLFLTRARGARRRLDATRT